MLRLRHVQVDNALMSYYSSNLTKCLDICKLNPVRLPLWLLYYMACFIHLHNCGTDILYIHAQIALYLLLYLQYSSNRHTKKQSSGKLSPIELALQIRTTWPLLLG